ncbi:MAG: DNA-formamidopyrimidine glycosylase family protein [Candidatus Eisenbacteria bacterium]
MPEMPDVTIYVEHLGRRLVGARVESVVVRGPNLLRTAEPPLADTTDRRVLAVTRMGKRIVVALDGERRLVLHLMIAGRLHWTDAGTVPRSPGKTLQALFRFSTGTLTLTEAGSKKRASLHYTSGGAALGALDPGGLEPLEASPAAFGERLGSANHTLKRALSNPRLFSGIGNAYSDEILHRARLSPLRLTRQLRADEVARLHEAVRVVLTEWTDRLRDEAGERFPEKVTAFRPGMAVHGRFGMPCPVCATPVQRIAYAENEVNYCPRCQTEGRLLADRSLSRLLRDDWPRTIEEWEEGHLRRGRPGPGRAGDRS